MSTDLIKKEITAIFGKHAFKRILKKKLNLNHTVNCLKNNSSINLNGSYTVRVFEDSTIQNKILFVIDDNNQYIYTDSLNEKTLDNAVQNAIKQRDKKADERAKIKDCVNEQLDFLRNTIGLTSIRYVDSSICHFSTAKDYCGEELACLFEDNNIITNVATEQKIDLNGNTLQTHHYFDDEREAHLYSVELSNGNYIYSHDVVIREPKEEPTPNQIKVSIEGGWVDSSDGCLVHFCDPLFVSGKEHHKIIMDYLNDNNINVKLVGTLDNNVGHGCYGVKSKHNKVSFKDGTKVINEKLLNKIKEIHYLTENCEGSSMANFIMVF